MIDSLKGLAAKLGGEVSGSVRPYLEAIQKLDFGITTPLPADVAQSVLLVNARLVPRASLGTTLEQLALQKRSSVVLDDHDTVLAALILPADLQTLAHRGGTDSPPRVDALLEMARTLPKHESELETLIWPHDVVDCHMKEMTAAMQWRVEHGDYTETADGVFVRDGVTIGQYAAVDTSEGPIVLDENVRSVRSVISGPFTPAREHA